MSSIDYSKTVIYKIVCKDFNIDSCYVGHTTNFYKRKSTHKSNIVHSNASHHNLKIYQMIRNMTDGITGK